MVLIKLFLWILFLSPMVHADITDSENQGYAQEYARESQDPRAKALQTFRDYTRHGKDDRKVACVMIAAQGGGTALENFAKRLKRIRSRKIRNGRKMSVKKAKEKEAKLLMLRQNFLSEMKSLRREEIGYIRSAGDKNGRRRPASSQRPKARKRFAKINKARKRIQTVAKNFSHYRRSYDQAQEVVSASEGASKWVPNKKSGFYKFAKKIPLVGKAFTATAFAWDWQEEGFTKAAGKLIYSETVGAFLGEAAAADATLGPRVLKDGMAMKDFLQGDRSMSLVRNSATLRRDLPKIEKELQKMSTHGKGLIDCESDLLASN